MLPRLAQKDISCELFLAASSSEIYHNSEEDRFSAAFGGQPAMSTSTNRFKAGYVYDEAYAWWNPGPLFVDHMQPVEHWENVETKARIHSLLHVTGLANRLIPVSARYATRQELLRFHTEAYIDKVFKLSEESDLGGIVGDEAYVGKGGYKIACKSAGGVLRAVENVMSGELETCYCLTRPPGHHALADKGM